MCIRDSAVSWNVKGASYRQSATDEQNFSVSGTLTLPDGVDNDNNLNLATSIDVNVKAYSPKIASAENNTITGIDYNGVYTTQSKISFTAVGAGTVSYTHLLVNDVFNKIFRNGFVIHLFPS